jgi:tetratricopeptide (TPR) repeat protein
VWDSLLARWPDNLAASIGLGNARAAQGDWERAAHAFEAAAARHDSAAAWHNLALVQSQRGQRDAARAAAARALARASAAEPAWRDAAAQLVERLR